MAKEHFPNLTIIARARDVEHYIKLRQAGVDAPERETFEGALKSGRQALESLGLGAYEARERADLFRRFNTQLMETMTLHGQRRLNAPAPCSPRLSTKIATTCR